jgi:O-antigen/teichoic acid export membrane protein
VIQLEFLSRRMYNSIFTLNLMLGLVVAIGLSLGSNGIASLYGTTDELPGVLQVLAVTFFIGATSQAQAALLTRRLAFGRLAVSDLVGALIYGVVTVWLAILGFGVWSLAIGYLASNFAIAVAIWLLNPSRPRMRIDWRDIREISQFSLNLTGANLFQFILGSADTLIISRFLGTSAVGYYSIARRFVAPVRTVAAVLSRVVTPALARAQNEDELLRVNFLRASAGLAYVIFPMLIGLAVVAPPFVAVVMGAAWLPAAPVIAIYSIGTLLALMLWMSQVLYFTKQRMRLFLRWTAIAHSSIVVAWLIGIQFGLSEMMLGYLLVHILLFFPAMRVPLKLINLGFGEYLRTLSPYLLSGGVMAGVTLMIRFECESRGLSDAVVLGAAISGGALIYVTMTTWMNPSAVRDFRILVGLEKRLR